MIEYHLADVEDLRDDVIPMIRSYLREQQMGGSPVLFTRKTLDVYRDLAHCYVHGALEGVVVVASEENRAVGFALAGEEPTPPRVDTDLGRLAQVWLVWVDVEHREQGVGLGMLSWGRPHLVEMGFVTACMCVREGNVLGETLTLAFGAEPVEKMFHFELAKEPGHGIAKQRRKPADDSGDALPGDGDGAGALRVSGDVGGGAASDGPVPAVRGGRGSLLS